MSLSDLCLKKVLQTKRCKKESWSIKKEERITERVEIWVHTTDYPFSHEFCKSYIIIEAKIIVPCDTQGNDILKREDKRT